MRLAFSQQTIDTVLALVPIDDTMFQKMCEDKAARQEMISTFLEDAVTVIEVVPQDSVMNLQGRSVRLDCLCRLSDGTYVLVEVQKADDDDHEERVRYNASVVTANKTPKSVKFRDVARIISIFISRFDIFGDGLPIYHVDRVVRETQKVQKNGLTEIYVNAAVKKRDNALNANVSDLMALFTDRDSLDYGKFPEFSRRKNAFTNTEEGVTEMCEKIERYYHSRLQQELFSFVSRGSMTLEIAAKEANLPPAEFAAQMRQNGYAIPPDCRPGTGRSLTQQPAEQRSERSRITRSEGRSVGFFQYNFR